MANRFKTGFVREFNEKQRQKAEEDKIRKKHNITDENVVVVEKTNLLKFIVRVLLLIIKTAAWILLIVLAAVGIICLLYPETRSALFSILTGIGKEAANMIYK